MNTDRSDRVRILAVDDDQNVLDLYEEFLSSPTPAYQFDLTLCHQSETAVEAVQTALKDEEPFAVAFLDTRMDSGPDGMWAAEQIRSLDPNIEIVMVTAHNDVGPEEIVSRVPPAGKLLYIRKPFSPEEIKQFAVALGAKWQQEIQLLGIQAQLGGRAEDKATDVAKTNKHVAREINERKQAENETTKRKNRYRAVVEDMPAMICRFLPDGTLTFVNGTYCSYFKKQREELLGENFFQFIPKQDQQKIKHHFLSLNPDSPMTTYDHQVISPDGTICWQRWTDRALFDEHGNAVEYQSIGYDITEHKQAEEALRESEERYRSILENIEEGYFEVDLAGNFTFVNDSLCRIAGYTLDELIGMNNRDYTTPETAKKMYQVFSKTYQTGEPARIVDYDIFKKDGSTKTLELSASLMANSMGESVGFRGVVRDVTKRKRAEEALRESEERYRSLFKNNHTVMLLIDPKTADIVDANPAACSFYGWGHEELTNKKITDINTLTDEQVFQEIERAKSEETQHFFFRHRLAKDEIVDVEVFSGPIVLNGKQLLYSIVHDITERKQFIEALRASEEKYRTVLEANPDPVVVYDIEGKVVYYNPAFTRVFGWSLGERLGKKMDVFVPEESWPETQKMVRGVLAGKSFSGIETRRYTKEGKIIPVSISGAVLRDMDGNPVGSVINLRDISEQKNLEGQLQQAQKMEAVGTLAGGIAHDFNNLLQAIQGYTELLLMRKKEGEPDWRELQEVVRASKRGAELTQQLLTFSRKVESKRRPLDLNQEVGELRELLERTIPKMIDVEFKLADNLKMVNADPAQLKQVLVNLAVNAKDAMPEGGKLLIETQGVRLDQEFCKRYAEVKPGHYVLFSISDTGHGMGKETLEYIFDPFYTTKEVGKGTGLGLAIVYGIIKNHEGYITCYSRPEVGTTFRIYLPTIEPETLPVDLMIAPEPKAVARGGKETILLVDDEEFIRELGADVLGRAGYTVLTASNGENALELYSQERTQIDLVILDLIMPGMGGSKCLEELLNIDPHARVLIASGYSPDGPTKGALDSGAKGFISKPYDTTQLLQLVRKILDGK
ncbi:MAG: PAS domain S-box protein [Deltaproteobacteria bacterium]|nr:PAS domain S-box protein [Deltaproteobacteria bacterium]